VSLALAPSYAGLCLVQGALVLIPRRAWSIGRSRTLGLVAPLAALAVGVAIVRAASGGAQALADLATVATPLLAAAAGWVRRWPLPWLAVPVAGGLYALAWRSPGTLAGEAAGVLLIGGACLTIAALVAAVAPAAAIAVGLVLLVVLDVILVWGVDQVGPVTTTLHVAAPPSLPLPGGAGAPLPKLQDATFGTALMGWLDILAPALLGAALGTRGARVRAAAATLVAALLWGLLLRVTSPIPATVPVLAGLAAGLALPGRLASVPGRLAPRP
jgi:hypothetical protein